MYVFFGVVWGVFGGYETVPDPLCNAHTASTDAHTILCTNHKTQDSVKGVGGLARVSSYVGQPTVVHVCQDHGNHHISACVCSNTDKWACGALQDGEKTACQKDEHQTQERESDR